MALCAVRYLQHLLETHSAYLIHLAGLIGSPRLATTDGLVYRLLIPTALRTVFYLIDPSSSLAFRYMLSLSAFSPIRSMLHSVLSVPLFAWYISHSTKECVAFTCPYTVDPTRRYLNSLVAFAHWHFACAVIACVVDARFLASLLRMLHSWFYRPKIIISSGCLPTNHRTIFHRRLVPNSHFVIYTSTEYMVWFSHTSHKKTTWKFIVVADAIKFFETGKTIGSYAYFRSPARPNSFRCKTTMITLHTTNPTSEHAIIQSAMNVSFVPQRRLLFIHTCISNPLFNNGMGCVTGGIPSDTMRQGGLVDHVCHCWISSCRPDLFDFCHHHFRSESKEKGSWGRPWLGENGLEMKMQEGKAENNL